MICTFRGDVIYEKIKRIIATILTVILCTYISIIPTYAAYINNSEISSYTLEGTSKVVKIGGTDYQYFYYTEGGVRKVDIINMSTNTIDRVVYDPLTSTIYLNESIISTGANPSTKLYSGRTTADGWQILSESSHYISWTERTSVAVVAAMTSAALGFGIGGAAVIGAIGSAGISVLAAACTGGTVYMELHMYTAPFIQPQYRYQWTFTANTGSKYGPYYYHV